MERGGRDTAVPEEWHSMQGTSSVGEGSSDNPNLLDQAPVNAQRTSAGTIRNVFWSQRANEEFTLQSSLKGPLTTSLRCS